jgi:ketosteroid isomerase-like protein
MPTNKEIMTALYAEIAKGNGRPYIDALADDVTFRAIGSNSWSVKIKGKEELVREVYARVRDRMEGPLKSHATRILADGDFVVVQARGDNTLKDGRRYANDYCMVFRFQNGKILEIEEYLDTELVTEVLGERV